jgi:endoglucanase
VRRAFALAVPATLVVAIAAAVVPRGGEGRDNAAHAAARSFLTRYVEPSGQVVRRDQGGDTVSEGQAYAMLIAAAIGDRSRFGRVWRWTQGNLQRPDGLFSWRPGDPQSASDADLDIARALLVGAHRFHRPALARSAHRVARAIVAGETAKVGRDRVLVAGPWARPEAIVDPSYFAPRTFELLGMRRLRASGLRIVRKLQDHRSGLAPDWARAVPGGAVPIGTPDDPGGQAVFGYDAVRIPMRLAESCDPRVRRDAAAPRASLQRTLAPVRDLGGTPLAPGEHAVTAVAAAAASAAAGQRAKAAAFLAHAAAWDRANPTYYGSAWVALGRIMLTTRWLQGCPPMR